GDDEWQLMYFDEAKVGCVDLTKEQEEGDGKKVVRRTTDSSMSITRLQTTISVVTSNWSLEDEKGERRELDAEANLAQAKTIQDIVRDGAKATVESRIGKQVQKKAIDWNPAWLSEGQADKLEKEKLGKGEKEYAYSTFTLESGEATIATKVIGKE